MAGDWVSVFVGPASQVLVVQAALEANGIATFVPDQTMKYVDPFITGANAFDLKLLVPDALAEQARSLLDRLRGEAAATLENDRAPAGDGEREGLRALGARVCWSSLFVLTAPLALFYAVRYFRAVRAVSPRPANHAWVLTATVLSAAETLIMLLSPASALWFV